MIEKNTRKSVKIKTFEQREKVRMTSKYGRRTDLNIFW